MKHELNMELLYSRAGFAKKADGSFVLPNNQSTADTLAVLAQEAVCLYHAPVDLVITGAGPVWAYLKIAHALHGKVARLTYKSPVIEVEIFNHGLATTYAHVITFKKREAYESYKAFLADCGLEAYEESDMSDYYEKFYRTLYVTDSPISDAVVQEIKSNKEIVAEVLNKEE